MAFSRIQRTSAYEEIVAQIEGAIADGTFSVGDHLPGERRLMEDFGVSRATVREAMRVLQATGVIDSRPGDPRGPVVTPYSDKAFEKSMTKLAASRDLSRVELLQFRLMLEANAAALAATGRTDDELADLRGRAVRIAELAAAGGEGFATAADEFQAGIRAASHNPLITLCGSVTTGVMQRMIDERLTSEPDRAARTARSARDAQEIVAAIADRDPHRAAAAVAVAIRRFYDGDLSDAEDAQVAPVLVALGVTGHQLRT